MLFFFCLPCPGLVLLLALKRLALPLELVLLLPLALGASLLSPLLHLLRRNKRVCGALERKGAGLLAEAKGGHAAERNLLSGSHGHGLPRVLKQVPHGLAVPANQHVLLASAHGKAVQDGFQHRARVRVLSPRHLGQCSCLWRAVGTKRQRCCAHVAQLIKRAKRNRGHVLGAQGARARGQPSHNAHGKPELVGNRDGGLDAANKRAGEHAGKGALGMDSCQPAGSLLGLLHPALRNGRVVHALALCPELALLHVLHALGVSQQVHSALDVLCCQLSGVSHRACLLLAGLCHLLLLVVLVGVVSLVLLLLLLVVAVGCLGITFAAPVSLGVPGHRFALTLGLLVHCPLLFLTSFLPSFLLSFRVAISSTKQARGLLKCTVCCCACLFWLLLFLLSSSGK